jgi:hypothetical protein
MKTEEKIRETHARCDCGCCGPAEPATTAETTDGQSVQTGCGCGAGCTSSSGCTCGCTDNGCDCGCGTA